MALLIDRLEKNLKKLLAKCVKHNMTKEVDVDWAPKKLSNLHGSYSAHFRRHNPCDVEVCVYVIYWAHLNKLIWTRDVTNPLHLIYSEYVALVAVLCEFDLDVGLAENEGEGMALLKQIPGHGFEKVEGLLIDWLESLLPQ